MGKMGEIRRQESVVLYLSCSELKLIAVLIGERACEMLPVSAVLAGCGSQEQGQVSCFSCATGRDVVFWFSVYNLWGLGC